MINTHISSSETFFTFILPNNRPRVMTNERIKIE